MSTDKQRQESAKNTKAGQTILPAFVFFAAVSGFCAFCASLWLNMILFP